MDLSFGTIAAMSIDSLAGALLADLAEPFTAEALFDQMEDTVFFIKNSEGRYVCVNQTLVARSGQQRKSDLLGCTPSEIFGEDLGRGFEVQDREVIRSGSQLIDKLELHVYQPRKTGWCLTTKLPLHGATGEVIGLVGVSRDLALAVDRSAGSGDVARAIAYAESRVSSPPSVERLAEVASMSPYQLDRRMRSLFGLSTGRWLLRLRMDQACHQLHQSTLPIAEIALACGYSDQSAFTRQFGRSTGMTPSDFRALRSKDGL